MAETPPLRHNLPLNLFSLQQEANGRLWRSIGLCATLRLPLFKRPGVRGYNPLVVACKRPRDQADEIIFFLLIVSILQARRLKENLFTLGISSNCQYLVLAT